MRSLFNLELDLVFYDTTSLHFEGNGPKKLAKKGYSKSKRPDLNQILIGVLLTKEGIPIGHEVFPGNTYDGTTLKQALDTLGRRFKIKRLIFVGERNLVSEENLNYLKEQGYEYILGVKIRNQREIREEIIWSAPI